MGIDPQAYYPVTGRCCRFLSVHENLGGRTSRENWRDTLRAYYSAFGGDDDVRLVIKTWKWKPGEFEAARAEVLRELGCDEAAAPPIEVLDGDLDVAAMRDLYQRAALFVKNANREGWSIPCTEAIACGTPVAATRIEPLLSHQPEGTRWFDPGDVAELARLLQRERMQFVSRLRSCQRSDLNVTATLVEQALCRLVERAGAPRAVAPA
jgi:glycosyltransferase involved in cell wall biosynthesis